MTFDDDLLAALRRSSDPADHRLAELLGTLTPARGRPALPRANEALTSFLVSQEPAVTGADPAPALAPDPAGDDLVVHLGRPTPRRRGVRSAVAAAFATLRTGAPAKAVLAASVALVGAGAAVATGTWPGTGPDAVVVTPTSGHTAPAGADRDADLEPPPARTGGHDGPVDQPSEPADRAEPADIATEPAAQPGRSEAARDDDVTDPRSGDERPVGDRADETHRDDARTGGDRDGDADRGDPDADEPDGDDAADPDESESDEESGEEDDRDEPESDSDVPDGASDEDAEDEDAEDD